MADLKLFVDTMMFLHFRPLGELKLRELFAVDSITVVVPSITIKELDKHKSTHPSRKVRDRAARAVRGFESGFADESADIRAELFLQHPKVELDAHQMNAESADEVLVASMLAYRKVNSVCIVALLTDDAFPRLLCKQHGMLASQVDDQFKLVDDLDATELENRDLKRKIQKLTSALPKLVISLSEAPESPAVATFKLKKFVPTTEPTFQAEKLKLQRQYPKMDPIPDRDNSNTLGGHLSRAVWANAMGISESDRRAYDRALDVYFDKTIEWLKTKESVRQIESRLLKPDIKVTNSGSAPADDISVTLYFPSNVQPLDEKEVPSCGDPPKPPEKPGSSLGLRPTLSGLLGKRPLRSGEVLMTHRKAEIDQTDGGKYLITDHLDKLKHGMSEDLFSDLLILLPPLEDARSFQCDYQIIVGNLPEPITGQLSFVIDKE